MPYVKHSRMQQPLRMQDHFGMGTEYGCAPVRTVSEPEPEFFWASEPDPELPGFMDATSFARGAERQTSAQSSMQSRSSSSSGVIRSDVMAVQNWTSQDVAHWLQSVGLGHCAQILKERNLTGASLFGLAGADLAKFGISALGDRKRILKAIRQLEVDSKQVIKTSGGPWGLHFMFMSASPLVTKCDGEEDACGEALIGSPSSGGPGVVEPLKALDVEAEQQAICKAIADADLGCRFQHVYATVRTLGWAVLHQSCCILVFSGHTLPTGQWLLETESGEALPFEPQELFQQRSGEGDGEGDGSCRPPRFRLVVLHAPHPGVAAEQFLMSGVPHVITMERAVDTEEDTCAPVFLHSLCQSLLRGASVEHAFAQAERAARHSERCQADSSVLLSNAPSTASAFGQAPTGAPAQSTPRATPSTKYSLLPGTSEHSEVLLPELVPGKKLDSGPARAVGQFPRTGLDLSSGRRLETWRVLRALRFRRLVQVIGPHGVGKRTLVCLVANYVWQRYMFPDGIHYVHVDDLMLRDLIAAEHEGSGVDIGADFSIPGRGSESRSGVVPGFLEKTPQLPGQRLLILDGCDKLYRHRRWRGVFIDWISRLLAAHPELQMIIVATTHLPVTTDKGGEPLLGTLEDHAVEVGELSQADALRVLHQQLRHVCTDLAALLQAQEVARGKAQSQQTDSQELAVRIVNLCQRLPFMICLFAPWVAAKYSDTPSGERVEALQQLLAELEDAQRGVLQPAGQSMVGASSLASPCSSSSPTKVRAAWKAGVGGSRLAVATSTLLGTILAHLPDELRVAFEQLASLPGSFSPDHAAALWRINRSDAEARLIELRSRRFVEVADSAAMAARLLSAPDHAALASTARSSPIFADESVTTSTSVAYPTYRLHPLLRQHIERLPAECDPSSPTESETAAMEGASGAFSMVTAPSFFGSEGEGSGPS